MDELSDKISNDVEDGQREEKEGVEKKPKEFIEIVFRKMKSEQSLKSVYR